MSTADNSNLDGSRLSELLSQYHCPAGHFDELRTQEGGIRPGYGKLLNGVHASLSPSNRLGFTDRMRGAKQSLRDNPPASTGQLIKSGSPQAWELDPIPLVICPEEWSSISAGLRQRMHLIDRLLRDVYGEQQLVARGILPASLVFGAPSYLRAARQPVAPSSRMLYLYAAQVAKSASGKWLVLADRTQGPSGCGHAVENRIAMSRILSEEFRWMHVERLAGFFSVLRQSLQDASSTKEKSSRTALLTPGIESPTYFEDAYLARYLGYTLTQTADLTVRGGSVFLKTLGGLIRIDSILRRMADSKCDPLEIDPTCSDGVAGLTLATRERKVLLANGLGTGWAESPAVTAILPRICQELLGEPLLLENSPIWWCGDAESKQYVIDNLDRLYIRDAFVRHSANQVVGRQLSGQMRDQVIRGILEQPWMYVGMTAPDCSHVPTWSGNHLEAWPAVVRFFACAYRDRIDVMPGGVARVADVGHKLDESLASGSMSKDVWVLSHGPVKPVSLLSTGKQSVELRRSPMDLPSRVAEHLYWLGRFAERTEFMVRHARYCTHQLTSELPNDLLAAQWQAVRALDDSNTMEEDPPLETDGSATAVMREAVRDFLFDRNKPDGIASATAGIIRNAETIRDRLSFDSWQIISRLDYSVLIPWANRREKMGDTMLILNQMIGLLSAFSGLASESMTRGPGWHFLDLGRRIDRAQNLLRLVDHLLVPVNNYSRQMLESMLDICDSSMTYRYRYLMSYEIGPVLDLLVVDQTNPRGLAFQFLQIVSHLDTLNVGDKTELIRQRKRMTDCRASLRLFDPDALGDEISTDEKGHSERTLLRAKLAEFTHQLNELSLFVSRRFLTHTAPKQLEDMVNQ